MSMSCLMSWVREPVPTRDAREVTREPGDAKAVRKAGRKCASVGGRQHKAYGTSKVSRHQRACRVSQHHTLLR